MTNADRQRLAAILGMLGSEHAGERAAAGLQAEAFRRRHGLTWDQVVSGRTVYVNREVFVETPVFVDRPMRLVTSIISIASEPFPCFFICTIIIVAAMFALARLVG